jgi:hypothetical protein
MKKRRTTEKMLLKQLDILYLMVFSQNRWNNDALKLYRDFGLKCKEAFDFRVESHYDKKIGGIDPV